MERILQFRRKSRALDGVDAGELVMIPRKGSRKLRKSGRKVFAPGDTIEVSKMEDLPGYPSSIDGWVLVGEVRISGSGATATAPLTEADEPKAVLEAQHIGRGKWQVVVQKPGYDQMDPARPGFPLSVGSIVSPSNLPRARAEEWARIGFDPGETVG